MQFFNIEDVESARDKLKEGKTAGKDNISVEHLLYAHPCFLSCIKLLFNIMLKWGYVPDDFGDGILIPLLKDKNGDAGNFDDYRGITVSCAISKLFEYAVIVKYSALFVTDNLQFGFKSGIGCNEALFTVKSILDYFINRGATMTVTALDIS